MVVLHLNPNIGNYFPCDLCYSQSLQLRRSRCVGEDFYHVLCLHRQHRSIYCFNSNKTIWTCHLVSSDSTTHLAVLATSSVRYYICTRISDWSTTSSDWALIVLSPTSRALLLRVCHVKTSDWISQSTTAFTHWDNIDCSLEPCNGILSCLRYCTGARTIAWYYHWMNSLPCYCQISTTNSFLMQRTIIITVKLVIVFSQTSVHFFFSYSYFSYVFFNRSVWLYLFSRSLATYTVNLFLFRGIFTCDTLTFDGVLWENAVRSCFA